MRQMKQIPRTRMGNSNKIVILVILIFGLHMYLFSYWNSTINNSKCTDQNQQHIKAVRENSNYFKEAAKLKEMGLLINTSQCEIPNISPWDSGVLHLITKSDPLAFACKSAYNISSYLDENDNVLVINTTELKKYGQSFDDISCCYKYINRVEQSLDNYNISADYLLSYSECYQMKKEREKITEEFLMVECIWKYSKQMAYRSFHATPLLSKSKKVLSKIEHWKNLTNSLKPEDEGKELPPNVLIVAIDSTSRLNFQRNMPMTRKFLQELGAVEMLGYIRVGINTFPNLIPLTTGYSQEDLHSICGIFSGRKLDDCPFIWKSFEDAGYLTAHAEDYPTGAIFQDYLTGRVGFVKQPVDFYGRTIFLAGDVGEYSSQKQHDYGIPFETRQEKYINCLGSSTLDEAITGYVESTLEIAAKNKAPIFSFGFSTRASHDFPMNIQQLDKVYSDFFTRIQTKGYLDNTILFFMGDHGYRWGPIKQTLSGYYEDNLPNLWIRLPPKLQRKFPDWHAALKNNARRLSSPFTFYDTLKKILHKFTSVSLPENLKDSITNATIPRKYNYNFFEETPENLKCEDIGIPTEYCPCSKVQDIQKIELNDSRLIYAAKVATDEVNLQLTSSACAPLTFLYVTSGAFMKIKNAKEVDRFIVGFVTVPGEFIFEAQVEYQDLKRSVNFQRTSKMNQSEVACVEDAKLKLICYCKDLIPTSTPTPTPK